MTLYYGTIKIADFEMEVDAEHEIELMVRRLIPSHLRFPLRFQAHSENVRIMRMVMSEYPLEILSASEWQDLLDGIKQEVELASSLASLKAAEASRLFQGELMPFQKIGLDFLLKTKGGALLADEMGLGKTVQALAYVSRSDARSSVVVVAPLITLENWRREIIRFLKMDVSSALGETPDTSPRIQVIRSGKDVLRPAEFYLINYEMVSRHVKSLKAVNPGIVIYDECQNLRNNNTIKYAACVAIGHHPTVLSRIGMSGTPIYNKGMEMYNIAEVIKPGTLGDPAEFIRKYCSRWDITSTDASDGKRVALSARLKKSIMLRRRKAEVLPDLPEKSKIQQNISIDSSAYVDALGAMYDKIGEAQRDLADMTGSEESKEGLFTLNKHIREMRVQERQIAGLSKVPYVVKYINGLLDDYEGEKFVIFAHHRAVHQAIFDGLFWYKPMQVIGGQSDKERQKSIDSFQMGDSRVIICGLRAGNVGINLTGAAYVIFAELDWSPSIHRQAEDRLHRIGQKRTVFSHYLVGNGTFDEQIIPRLLDKTVTIADALGDKLETLDNEKALRLLEARFGTRKGVTTEMGDVTQVRKAVL